MTIQTFLSILILLVLMSYASVPKSAYIQPEFQEGLDSFLQDAKNYGVKVDTYDLKIVMVDLVEFTNSFAGYCDLPSNTILIFKSHWDTFSPTRRKYLIYHELGHCLLQRKHVVGRLPMSYCSISIMATVDEDYCYSVHGEHYINELFRNPYNGEFFKERKPF